MTMLGKSPAFSSFAVSDLGTARSFYSDILGLSVTDLPEMGLLQLDIEGGRPVMVYPKEDFVPATYTILNFPVADIDEAVRELAARGVTFQRYDGFEQDEAGIARGMGPAIAWFTDPAGNVIAVLEESPA
jgi:predicted enzyme related to lactoylglutathione lyase